MMFTNFITGLLGLAVLASAGVIPPKENNTSTLPAIEGFGLDMETALIDAFLASVSESELDTLEPRDDLPHTPYLRDMPPRGMLLAEQITHDDLPMCYQNCMRVNDGKSSIHMGKDTLGQIAGSKWPLFVWWSDHHVRGCVKHACTQDPNIHARARCWLKTSFGKPKNIC